MTPNQTQKKQKKVLVSTIKNCILTLLALLAINIQLQATDIAPNASGDFSTAATWDPVQVPGASDNIIIQSWAPIYNGNKTITLASDHTIQAININHNIDVPLTFSSGDASPHTFNIGSIGNSGTGVISLIIENNINVVVGSITNFSYCNITIKSGGSLTVTGNTTIGWNNASIVVENGGSATFSSNFTANASLLQIDEGSNVTFGGNVIFEQSTFALDINAELEIPGDLTLSNASSLSIAEGTTLSVGGDVLFSGGQGTYVVDGALSVTGDINADWGFEITGDGSISAGTYTGNGTILGSSPAGDIPDGTTQENAFYSITDGLWTSGNTWSRSDGGSAAGDTPSATDKVIICNSNRVSFANNQNNTSIKDVTIRVGGILDANGKSFTINGNLEVNGTYYAGGNSDLDFTGGAGTSIGGQGIISLKHSQTNANLNINGNTEIDSSANLFLYGSIIIDAGISVTNYGTIETTLNIEGNNATSTWVNSTNSTLKVSGTLLETGVLDATTSGNTVEYLMNGDVTLAPLTYTYYNLVVSGTGTKSQDNDLTINGNFTISSGTYDPLGNNLDIKGNWLLYNDSYTEGTETVTFSGTGDQSIANPIGETFFNLTVNKASGTLNLSNDVNVSGTFTFSDGVINTGENTLTLGTISNEGTLAHSNSSIIIGNFKRYIDITNIDVQYLFPVGTSSDYRPAKIDFDNMTATGAFGSLVAEFIEASPGALNPRPTVDTSTTTDVYNTFSDGYWKLTAGDGLSTTKYDLDLIGTNFNAFTPGESTRLFARSPGGQWISDGTHSSVSGSTARRLNMKTLSAEYCFADITPCNAPSLSNLTGDASVCINGTTTYTVTSSETSSTFVWEVVPAEAGTPDEDTRVEAGYTSSIDIDWSNTGYNATVKVTASNTCTLSDPIELSVSSEPIAPTEINGLTSVPANASGEAYSVTDLGYTYNWTITGGTQVSGGTTNSITVDWGDAGAGKISITATNGCGTTPAFEVDINKYIVIESIKNGQWQQTATWDCGCVPEITDNVRITGGFDVEVKNNGEASKNLIVDGGSTLTTTGQDLEVNGDLIINGDAVLDINITGAGSNISGAGTITGNITSSGGNKNILPSATLDITGNFTIDGATISTINSGHITINGDLIGTGGISWTNDDNSHLTVSGALLDAGNLEASSTNNIVEYSGANQTIKAANNNKYYNLAISGTGPANLESSLDINGYVNISNTATLDVEDAVTAGTFHDLTVAGDWLVENSGAFNEQTATVTFDGSNDQTITNAAGEIFNNLIINKSSGNLILANNLNAASSLTMTNGDIDLGSNNLTLGTNTPTEGTLTYSSGKIIATNGNFVRWLTNADTMLFPIGSSSTYYPASIIINTISSAGSLSASFSETDPGVSGTITDGTTSVTNQFTDGYWTMVADAISIDDYKLSFTGTDFSSYTINSATRVLFKDGTWADPIPGTHNNAVGSTCYRTVLAADNYSLNNTTYIFGLGETDCAPIAEPTINGTADVCINDDQIYSVTDNGNTYTWDVTGDASFVDNGASITVTWGNTASLEAKVEVVESSGCYSTPASLLDVNIHSLETSTISGPTDAPENLTIGTYEIAEVRSGYTYTWSAVGGTPTPTTGSSVSVAWGAANPTASLIVSGQYGSCTAAADETLTVNVYASNTTKGNGDWSDATNWTGNEVPNTGATNQSANIGAGHIITLDMAPTVENLVISDGASVIDDGTTQDITITNGYFNNGTHTTNGNVILSGTSSMTIDADADGTLTLTNGTLQITSNVSNELLATSTLTVNGDISISDNVTLTNNGTLTLNGNLTGAGNGATLENATNATLLVSGNLLTTGILNASSTGNTINYSGTAAQTIKSPSSNQYYNLTLSGSNTKSLSANTNIDGNLTISGTDVLDVTAANNYSINIGGNWINTSAAADPFLEQNGNVTFDGSTDQTITNTNGETFHNFYVIKSLGGSIIQSAGTNITISNFASFQKGIVNTTSPDMVIFADGATVGGTSGDADSFVDGLVRKIGSTGFTFPTGTASTWARIGISSLSGSLTFTAQYFDGAYSGTALDGALTKISSVEYWNLDRAEGSGSANVTLHWEDSARSGIGAAAYASDLVVAHWNSSLNAGSGAWESMGQAVITSELSGSITSISMSEFSPVTGGSEGDGNPLPIDLISFDATPINNHIQLNWTTASEKNNDYYELQRSEYGLHFEYIGEIKGAGNSAINNDYSFIDSDPINGTAYYRLKQVDFNGEEELYKIISVDWKKKETLSDFNNVSLFPNPYEQTTLELFTGNLEIQSEIIIRISTMSGKLIQQSRNKVPENAKINIIPNIVSSLDPGIYFIKLETEANTISKKLLVK